MLGLYLKSFNYYLSHTSLVFYISLSGSLSELLHGTVVTSTASGRRTRLVKAFGCRKPIATLFVDPIKAFRVTERRNRAMTRL
jgi:hypothetical protein